MPAKDNDRLRRITFSEAIREATKNRIRPIFMSVLTSVFGMMPADPVSRCGVGTLSRDWQRGRGWIAHLDDLHACTRTGAVQSVS